MPHSPSLGFELSLTTERTSSRHKLIFSAGGQMSELRSTFAAAWQVSIRPDPFGGFSDMIKEEEIVCPPFIFKKHNIAPNAGEKRGSTG